MAADFWHLCGGCWCGADCMCLAKLDLGTAAWDGADWRRRRLHVRHTLIGGKEHDAYDYMVCPAMALPSFGEEGKVKGENKKAQGTALFILSLFNQTRSTLPERRQRVQTRIVRGLPSIITRARWRLGTQVRRVFRWEWLTWFPAWLPFWQMAHTLDMA